jgi:Rrf2 family iron-sulfur cluster assembly transcriptional regulator
MRMTTKGRFAVTAMIDLALRAAGGPVALSAISLRQKISLSYLEQLFGKLRRDGIVESVRGPGGGYALARGTGSISVADIVAAVDDRSGDPVAPEPPPAPGDGARCDTSDLWRDLDARMLEFLASISLETLVAGQRARGISVDGVPPRRGISLEPVVKPIRTDAPNSVFALGSAVLKQSRLA